VSREPGKDLSVVTGGSGFVGLSVVERLLQDREDVIIYDRVKPPAEAVDYLEGLPGKLRIVQGDVLDATGLAECIGASRPSCLVHCAAITPNTSSEMRDPALALNVNFSGTVNVLEQARQISDIQVICVSSSGIYGDLGQRRDVVGNSVSESLLPAPTSLYAISKSAAEQAALRYRELFGMNIIVVRVGVAFGPWEYDTGIRDPLSVHLMLARLAMQGARAVLPRDPSKDWVYSRDIAGALAALKRVPTLSSTIFNVSGPSVWSAGDFARRLAAEFPSFEYLCSPTAEAPANIDLHGAKDRPVLDISRLRAEAGFVPHYGLEQAFTDYVAWMRRFELWK
jgi:UDP-glucuronate 4-epimerase